MRITIIIIDSVPLKYHHHQQKDPFLFARAVTVPAQNPDQPKTEALNINNVQASLRQEPTNEAPAELTRDKTQSYNFSCRLSTTILKIKDQHSAKLR